MNQQQLPSLSNALQVNNGQQPNNNNNNIHWDIVRQILMEEPEQACLYAHGGLEDSWLYVAIKQQAPLDVVIAFIDAYEEALDQRSPTDGGATVLHAAASLNDNNDNNNNNASEVVSYLLKMRPELASMKDSLRGELPLHQCRNVESAKHLLRVNPSAMIARSSKFGNIPLHSFLLHEEGEEIGNNCIQLLKLFSLSSKNKQLMTIRNKHGQTPLQLLISKVEQRVSTATVEVDGGDHPNNVDELWNVLLDWVRTLSLSREEVHQRQPQMKFTELHTLIEYGCCYSEQLMKYALNLYGEEQASMRDTYGRTPLHVAAAASEEGSAEPMSPEAIQALLKSNPKAPRTTDNEGRLPIDIAAESPNIHIQSLAVLMRGEPRAIDTRDLRDGHYPFISAALSSSPSSSSSAKPQTNSGSINNVYFLLRAKPHVLSYFHTP